MTPLLGTPPQVRGDLFHRVALALNSTLDLAEVLRTLAGLALEASAADRCSLFLLEGDELRPAVALGRSPDDHAWELFRAMGPLRLSDVPGGRQVLRGARAVHIPHAPDSDLVPKIWSDHFDLKALVIVPLSAAGGDPCGAMAIDSEHGFTSEEVLTLEALGAYAGIAVRNARSYEAAERRARYQQALAEGAAALVSPLPASDIVERLADSYLTLVGADVCLIGLLDRPGEHLTTLTTRGPVTLAPEIPLSSIPDRITSAIADAWRRDPGPIELEDEAWLRKLTGAGGFERYLMLPIAVGSEAVGAVLMGFRSRSSVDHEAIEAGEALAALAGSALERSLLSENLERKLRCAEILHDLGAALQEQTTNEALRTALNRLLEPEGIQVLALDLADATLARLRDSSQPMDPSPEEALALPMNLDKRSVGTMRLLSGPGVDRAFLQQLADGVAEVAARATMRLDIEEAERERTVMAVRESMAADLHDTAGQILVAIGLLARRHLGMLPEDSDWRERIARFVQLSEEGKWEIDQAVRALSFFPAARRGLVPSIRAFVRSFEVDSGVRVIIDVEGEIQRLDPNVERALYRVAHEALSNAWRHARASVVRIELEFQADRVNLRIVDDGVGLAIRLDDVPTGMGTTSMRKAMLDVGGDLHLHAVKPHGSCVEAACPVRRPG